MDAIIEKELLEKHVTVTYNTNSGAYNMKFYGFDNKIRDCNVSGNTIEFIEKKGAPCFIAELYNKKLERYIWEGMPTYDNSHLIEAWYSKDLSDILLLIDFNAEILLLHQDKDSKNYTAYLLVKDAFKKIAMERSDIYEMPASKVMDMPIRYLKWRGKKSY